MGNISPELKIALRYNDQNPIESEYVPAEDGLPSKRIGFVGLESSENKSAPSAELYVVRAGKVQIREVRLPKART